MRKLLIMGKFLAGIIAIASGVITLVFNDVSYTLFDKMPFWLQYICIGIMIVIGILIVVSTIYDAVISTRKASRTHRLKYQSKKFMSFFTKWYSKPGALSIICKDLDWVRTNTCAMIYEQLIRKSKQEGLKLYLASGFHSKTVQELQQNGAQVFVAPTELVQNYTFSCLSVMDNDSGKVIVRAKYNDDGEIVIFKEVNNKYVTDLLNAMLTITRESLHEQS